MHGWLVVFTLNVRSPQAGERPTSTVIRNNMITNWVEEMRENTKCQNMETFQLSGENPLKQRTMVLCLKTVMVKTTQEKDSKQKALTLFFIPYLSSNSVLLRSNHIALIWSTKCLTLHSLHKISLTQNVYFMARNALCAQNAPWGAKYHFPCHVMNFLQQNEENELVMIII